MSERNWLVSVVIPCWNQARFLQDCIRSLQAQTWEHWEAIIVNDGSPDDTGEVAREIAKTEPRVRYVEKPNGGVSSARNAGLDVANGDFVQFLDADDVIFPRKFEAQLSCFRAAPEVDICYCAFRCGSGVDVYDSVASRSSTELVLSRPVLDFAARWENDLSIPIHSPLFRGKFFLVSGIGLRFDESLRRHEDWDLWIRLCTYEPVFHRLEEELVVYRGGGRATANRKLMWQNFDRAVRKQVAANAHDPDLCDLLRVKRAFYRYRYGYGLRGWAKARLESDWVRNSVPWKAQKLMHRIVGAPKAPPTTGV
jgi:glycosyltransferase involved in cell wall biosynthesis